uniref:Calcium homeostasis modulator 1 n=1 Tax=Neogobius melanostomus TaxID=47308 RepID=A0A8C6WXA5_9GOBI
MDRFRMMNQVIQSNQESFMKGICGIMAVASTQIYQSFDFYCPCRPEYNYAYGMGLILVPPISFFLLGFILNNNVSLLMEEWKRPTNGRRKDPITMRYMVCSMTQRSLIAPSVWVTVTLMHGQSFICAFSTNLEIERFGNFSVFKGLSEEERIKILARIPCDEDTYFEHHEEIRLMTTTYIKCISQACGWMFLFMMTFSAFLIRAIRPCFSQATFLKTKYWSHYIDTERKMFDETCREHAKSFAKLCIQQYFEGISGKKGSSYNNRAYNRDDDEEQESDDEKLMGIKAQKDMNKVLWNWHTGKPTLDFRKDKMDTQSNGHLNGYKKPWSMYYSKV